MNALASPANSSAREAISAAEIRELPALEALAPEWFELWRRSDSTPFQSPMWLIPWARHFTHGNLLVLALHQAERLIALAPFYTWTAPETSTRKLLLLGNGHSDYLDVCVDPAERARVRAAIARWLSQSDSWADCEFNQLPKNSMLRQLEISACAAAEEPGDVCPVLSSNEKPITEIVPERQLHALYHYRRRLAKEGPLEFKTATETNASEYLENLFALHQARWREHGAEGVLADPTVRAFHREATVRFARQRALRLYALIFQEKIIAVLYAFADQHRTCFYLSGFDPNYAKFSPGVLILGHAVEQAINSGCRHFDFLRGTEPYKYDWGAIDQPTWRWTCQRRSRDGENVNH